MRVTRIIRMFLFAIHLFFYPWWVESLYYLMILGRTHVQFSLHSCYLLLAFFNYMIIARFLVTKFNVIMPAEKASALWVKSSSRAWKTCIIQQNLATSLTVIYLIEAVIMKIIRQWGKLRFRQIGFFSLWCGLNCVSLNMKHRLFAESNKADYDRLRQPVFIQPQQVRIFSPWPF